MQQVVTLKYTVLSAVKEFSAFTKHEEKIVFLKEPNLRRP